MGKMEMTCLEALGVFEQEVEEILVDQKLRWAAYQHIWSCSRDRRSPCPARVFVEQVWGSQGECISCQRAQKMVQTKDWSKIGTRAQEQEFWQAFYHLYVCRQRTCQQILSRILKEKGICI